MNREHLAHIPISYLHSASPTSELWIQRAHHRQEVAQRDALTLFLLLDNWIAIFVACSMLSLGNKE